MKSYSNFNFKGGYFRREDDPDRYFTGFDVRTVQDDDVRDNIFSPSDGQFIITLHDLCINIYDGSQLSWKKLHSRVHPIADQLSGNTGMIFCRNVSYIITISTGGEFDSFTYTSIDRHQSSVASNGPLSRVVIAGSTNTNINHIDFISFINLTPALTFGELDQKRTGCMSTSNNINNRAIFAGDSFANSVSNSIEHINISSTGNGIDFGDLNLKRQASTAISNGKLNRAVIIGSWQQVKFTSWSNCGGESLWCWGTNSIQSIDYINISTPGNAVDFGDVSYQRWNGDGCSNLEYNIGLRSPSYKFIKISSTWLWQYCWNCYGNQYLKWNWTYTWNWWWSTELDFVKITTPGNSTFFGNLYWDRWYSGIVSNGVKNKAIIIGKQPSNVYAAEVINLLARDGGTAEYYGWLYKNENHYRGASNA